MTLEQRITDALATVDELEPSVDLWARVNRSIEEDRAHRRRLRRVLIAVAVVLAGLVAAGWVFSTVTTLGTIAVDWKAMEVIEAVALVMIMIALGPAIRRFGDGYAGIVFRANPPTGERFIRLLDVAYYLTFGGYVLLTSEFERPIEATLRLGEQVQTGSGRIGGLLLLMGVLHAVTVVVLPLIGLVFTATWRQRPLARWVNVLLTIGAVFLAAQVVGLIAVLLLLGAGI